MADDMMKNCICTYSTGFFIESNFEALCHLAEQSAAQNKIFGFNLASEEISKTHKKQFLQILEYVDILFCNKQEALDFARVFKLECGNKDSLTET